MAVNVDGLYRVPLADFTRARNELARQAGKAGAPIRKLQKPNVPAWAVNQLYWHRRASWDRLLDAARALRSAHGRRLSGREVDLDAAEAGHQAAIRAAADEIRALLREAGEVASAATRSAAIETLQALPATGPPGRLTRPLKPMGLEALAGLVRGAGSLLRPVTRPHLPEPESARPPTKRERDRQSKAETADRREAERRKRETAGLARQLREARTAERRAQADLTRAREALARIEREHGHLSEKLKFLEKQRGQATAEVRSKEQRLSGAAGTRDAIEHRRNGL